MSVFLRWIGSHRWFALAWLFLLVNVYGVWRLDAASRRDTAGLLVQFKPGDGQEIKRNAALEWTFSEPMISEAIWNDQSVVVQHLNKARRIALRRTIQTTISSDRR